MVILIRSGDSGWSEPTLTGYENEASLQQLIAEHPSLVPGISELAIACREFSTGVGPSDVVILDESGDLTLIECKLTTNPQIRREIVGQVLDYASRLWGKRVEEFEATWRRAAKSEVSPLTAFDGEGADTRERLAENLEAGRIRLVLAVDRVNHDMKRIVEYLNTITLVEFAVFVMAFQRAQRDGVEVLIPTAYGSELAGGRGLRERVTRERWPIEAYAEWGDQNDSDGMPAYRELRKRLLQRGWQMNGVRASTSSLNASLDVPALGGVRKWPLSLQSDAQRGLRLNVRFVDFASVPEVAERMVAAVEASVPGVIDAERVRAEEFKAQRRLLFASLSPQQAVALVDALTGALADM